MQIFVSRASGQQWLRQAQTLHKQLYCTHQRLCAVKDSEYDVFDEEDSSDEESQASIPERKPMQAMAMPKKKKGSTQQQATNNGAARSVASPADRSKERPAAKGEVKAATYTGIGGYDARVKAAGRSCNHVVSPAPCAAYLHRLFTCEPCVHVLYVLCRVSDIHKHVLAVFPHLLQISPHQPVCAQLSPWAIVRSWPVVCTYAMMLTWIRFLLVNPFH